MAKVERENIGWIDGMRVLACFLVVFSHSCDAFVAQFNNDYGTFLQGCALGSLVRPCVPLFVMMNFTRSVLSALPFRWFFGR